MRPAENNDPRFRPARHPLAAGAMALVAGSLALATALPFRPGVAAAPHQGSAASVAAAVAAAPVTARVTDAFGKVERQASGDKTWKSVNVGDLLATQTTLRTGDNAACLLRLAGGHVLRVGANTTVLLRELGKDNQYSFKVFSGQVWSMVRKANHPARYEVETPSAVAGVTGTIFSVAADPTTGETTVSTDEGSVKVRHDGDTSAAVTKGFFLRVPPHLVAGTRPTPGMMSKMTPAVHRRLQVQAQDERMRHMWSLLRTEGILVRKHETGASSPTPTFRLQRRIEPLLIQDWRGFRIHNGGGLHHPPHPQPPRMNGAEVPLRPGSGGRRNTPPDTSGANPPLQ